MPHLGIHNGVRCLTVDVATLEGSRRTGQMNEAAGSPSRLIRPAALQPGNTGIANETEVTCARNGTDPVCEAAHPRDSDPAKNFVVIMKDGKVYKNLIR